MTDTEFSFEEDRPVAEVTLPQAPLVGSKMNLIEVVRGTNAVYEATMRTKENLPFDLSGKELRVDVIDQDSRDHRVLIEKSSTDASEIEIYDPAAGLYRIKFVPEDTWAIYDRVYRWNLTMVDGALKTRLIERAEFVVSPNR